jgi:hypothetical protein
LLGFQSALERIDELLRHLHLTIVHLDVGHAGNIGARGRTSSL